MARPQSDGLNYFPFDVDFFSDRKIKSLRGKYGNDGINVYLYLLCEIYKNGYYLIYDEDLVLCIADDINISEESTRQMISYLLSRSLLCEIKDSKLAKSVTVISAKSVQKRFQEAKKGLKRNVSVNPNYWLLDESETLGFIKVQKNINKFENNPSKSRINSNISRINSTKESKVKESKVKENIIQEDLKAVVSFYEDNFCLCVPFVLSEIKTYLKNGIDFKTIIEAMQKALGANKKSWNYVKGILRNTRGDDDNERISRTERTDNGKSKLDGVTYL